MRVFAETEGGPPRFVRVNAADTEFFAADVAVLSAPRVDGVVLPKASPPGIGEIADVGLPVLALVETATGVLAASELAASTAVFALMLGGVDLSLELGLQPRRDGIELLHARSTLVVASAAAGIRPPFDVVHMNVRDGEGLEHGALLARSLGFGGKACIHPAQLDTVNRVFSPTADEVAWAERVVETAKRAAAEGRGVALVDGSLVDAPVVERARRILAAARD